MSPSRGAAGTADPFPQIFISLQSLVATLVASHPFFYFLRSQLVSLAVSTSSLLASAQPAHLSSMSSAHIISFLVKF